MFNRAILVILVLAVAVVAMAGTLPSGVNQYRVTLLQTSVLNGTELKAGDYKLAVDAGKLVISGHKQSVQTDVQVESGDAKFPHTVIRYTKDNGRAVISEIHVGGTTTKLIFNR
jgi:hypothetical protein